MCAEYLKKVSIIIPTYKRAEYIDRAILSILHQTYTNYEIIVVDDNNPQTEDRIKLEEKMKKYTDDRIIYIKHEKNMNGAVARNTGIKKATGDYITFLDDDDFFLKNRIEILVKFLNENKQYDAVYTSGCVLYKDLFHVKKSGNLKKEMLMLNPIIRTGSNMFFRKNVFDNIGMFDESFNRHQDIEFMVRFFDKFKIYALDKILVVKDDSIKRINWPNAEITVKNREKFLEKFSKDLNEFEDKNYILQRNYLDLFFKICRTSDKKILNYVYEKIKSYGKISFKNKIKIVICSKFNFILNIKYFIKSLIVKFQISFGKKTVFSEIREYLNIKDEVYEK